MSDTPTVADFNRGGKYNLGGYLTPARACERYYLHQRLFELGVLPVYSMPEGADSVD